MSIDIQASLPSRPPPPSRSLDTGILILHSWGRKGHGTECFQHSLHYWVGPEKKRRGKHSSNHFPLLALLEKWLKEMELNSQHEAWGLSVGFGSWCELCVYKMGAQFLIKDAVDFYPGTSLWSQDGRPQFLEASMAVGIALEKWRAAWGLKS